MSSQWKPGDVAMLRLDADTEIRVRRSIHGDWVGEKGAVYDNSLSARRLVVIDPEDREQIDRLEKLYDAALSNGKPHHGPEDCLQAALREFANPKQEVFEHLPVSDNGDGQTAAWCGKVWVRQPNVKVIGRCPECVELTEKGWLA